MKNKYLEKVALLSMLGGFQGAKKEDLTVLTISR